MLILTLVNYNFCYSQKSDNDIEHLKKNIIGTWVSTRIDTTGYYSSQYFTEKHTFTSKNDTLTFGFDISNPYEYHILVKEKNEPLTASSHNASGPQRHLQNFKAAARKNFHFANV